MKKLTCDSVIQEFGLRCWRRAGICDGRHFAVRPHRNPEITTRPDIVRWTDYDFT